MTRKPKQAGQADPWQDAEATMAARAAWLARNYPMLRLRLARFAWCAEGVEARARIVVRDWGRAFFALCEEDARKLEVSSDRYVRGLLDFVPPWSIAILVALARHDRACRAIVPGLRQRSIRFPEHEDMIARFAQLMAPRALLGPDQVAMVVRIRPEALEQARARWAERGIKLPPPRQPRRRVRRAPAPRMPRRDSRAETVKRLLAAVAKGNAPAAEDIAATVALLRRGGKAAAVVARAVRAVHQLPAGPTPALLAALPAKPRRAPANALRILAAGKQGAAAELARMTAPAARRALKLVHLGTRGRLEVFLADPLLSAPGATPPRDGRAMLLDDLVADTSHDAEVLARLLQSTSAIGRGKRLQRLARHVGALGAAKFAEFLHDAAPLEAGWHRLPVSLREAALASWNAATKANPELRTHAAGILPSLALEAARWAGDHEVLGLVLAGPHAAAGFATLARVEPGFARDAVLVARNASASMPGAWLDLARGDVRVLRLLVQHDLARLARGPLAGLALAPLMQASLRNRMLARRIDEEFDAGAITAAMPALRRALAGQTKRIAAAELAALLGWRHAVALAFLATRPYAPPAAPGTRFDRFYRSWEIPKRRGGKRRITAPVPLLKAIQRRLLDAVFAAAPCHPAATGFRPGISIADNARPHVGRKVVVNVDIEGFFPNTRFKRVRRTVERALPRRLSPEARRLAVDICSMDGGLPIGAPTSPAIANLVMLPVDRALAKVAARHAIAYTRYADDLTLSGDDPARLLPFLREAVGKLGYRLDPKKTNFFRRGRRQVVTGLVVNDKVSVPRKLRRRLRAAVHRVATRGGAAELTWHGRAMDAGELAGRIAFAGVAHPEESRALAAQLREGLAGKRRRRRRRGGAAPGGDAP